MHPVTLNTACQSKDFPERSSLKFPESILTDVLRFSRNKGFENVRKL